MRLFQNWAQPVVSQKWAMAATVLFAISSLFGFGKLHHWKHVAWMKACGLRINP
jgi:hypothetical protein